MATIWHYFYEYLKTGKYTAFFLLLVGAVLLVKKFWKLKQPLPTLPLLFLILALGLGLRIGWLGYSAHMPQSHWNAAHMLENDWINMHAIELTQGIWFHGPDGLPSGRRPIGYPIVLGLCYKIFDIHLVVAWALNLVLYGWTLLLLFRLAKKIFGDPTALLTCFLFAIYPISIYSVKLLTDEHLFLPVWYWGLALLFDYMGERKSRWDWLWLGLIFGYTTMIRTHTIFMPLIAGFAYWLIKRPWAEVLGKIVLIALVMQLLNLPWAIRNYNAWGVPVLYTATSKFVYAQVNSTAGPEGNGHIPEKGEPGYSAELDAALHSTNQGLAHQLAGKEMKRWVVEHPGEFAVMGISRLLNFMNFNRKGGVWALWHQYYPGSFDPARPLPKKLGKTLHEYAFAFYYILFFSWLFAMVGLVRCWKNLQPLTRHCLIVLGACFLMWFGEHTLIGPDRKYRFPLEPLMMISMAWFLLNLAWPSFLTQLAQKIFKRKGSKT